MSIRPEIQPEWEAPTQEALEAKALDKLPKSDFQAVIEAIKDLSQTPRPKRY